MSDHPGDLIPLPASDVDEAPLVCVQVNEDWIPILSGVLANLRFRSAWGVPNETEMQRALQNIDLLNEILGTAGICPVSDYAVLVPRTSLAGQNFLLINPAPTEYRQLRLTLRLRSNTVNAARNMLLRLNSDSTAANYRSYNQRMFSPSTQSELLNGGTVAAIEMFNAVVGGAGPAGCYAFTELWLTDLDADNSWKPVMWRTVGRYNTLASGQQINHGTGEWLNVANPIAHITLEPSVNENFATDSWYMLEGFGLIT